MEEVTRWRLRPARRLARTIVIPTICLFLASCSLFVSSTQAIRVVADDDRAEIYMDGQRLGTGEVVAQVARGTEGGHEFKAVLGHKRGFAWTFRSLSETGLLDSFGGCFLIVPWFGLLSDGAYQQAPARIVLQLRQNIETESAVRQ